MKRPAHSIVMADDHPLVVRGLVKLLEAEPNFRIVALCDDGEAALDAIRTHSPQLALLDTDMPKIDGLSLVHRSHGEFPGTRIVLLGAAIDDKNIAAAVSAGAWGLVLKEAPTRVLLRCLKQVAEGEPCYLPFVRKALARERARRKRGSLFAKSLTNREQQVLMLVSRGYLNKEIANELSLSDTTVRLYMHRIYRKAKLKKRSALAELGILVSQCAISSPAPSSIANKAKTAG